GAGQETEFRLTLVAPAGSGMVSGAQLAPSQASATAAPLEEPTAMQDRAVTHDTPFRLPLTAGPGWEVQRCPPCHASARVSPGAEPPTAGQLLARVPDPAFSPLWMAPPGSGLAARVQVPPFHASARVSSPPDAGDKFPAAVQLVADGQDTSARYTESPAPTVIG